MSISSSTVAGSGSDALAAKTRAVPTDDGEHYVLNGEKMFITNAGIADLFSGPTMVSYSEDPVAAPKVIAAFAKDHDKLVVLGGALGSTVLDADGVKALASMPSLDELRAKLVGMIQTPATRIAGVTQAPAAQLARVMQAYADKGEAA